MERKFYLKYQAAAGFLIIFTCSFFFFTACSRVDIFSDNEKESPEDEIPTPVPTTAPATALPTIKPDVFFVYADSMLCHFTKDTDNDGTDDIDDPALFISYYSDRSGIDNIVIPDHLFLYQPVISDHTYSHGDRSVCTICLDKMDIDCDYCYDNTGGMIIMPFKGELLFPDTRVLLDPLTGDGSTWGKPDPDAVDYAGNIILHMELRLCSSSGQEEKRISPVDTVAFWNHDNTIAYFESEKSSSRIIWDMNVEFLKDSFDSLEEVQIYMIMDIPIRGSGPSALKATAFIIPEDYFNGTPYRYGTDAMKDPDVEYITMPSIRFFY
ncbi:MAG: hypothetical protein JW881_21035 [Spirochaetales bacterium]|nr:hypothetical protein [Spirochaetales bacterium]